MALKADMPEIQMECRIATSMAKSMSSKLKEYKSNFFHGYFDINPMYEENINKIVTAIKKDKDV